MTDSISPTAEDKREASTWQLRTLAEDLTNLVSAVEHLCANPTPDAAHYHAETVRLVSLGVEVCASRRDHLIQIASREPDRVSFPRLATLSNLSVNTLRNRQGLNDRSATERLLADGPGF